jgi:hypothetical protein
MNLKKLERYLRVNLLGPGRPSSYEMRICRAACGLTKVEKHWLTVWPRGLRRWSAAARLLGLRV